MGLQVPNLDVSKSTFYVMNTSIETGDSKIQFCVGIELAF